MKLPFLEKLLRKKRLKVFSTRDLRMLLKISEVAAYRLLWRYEKKGFVVKLKRGLYALKTNLPSTYLIANILYQPSYISFDTALSYHGIIPETIYSVTSATTKITRTFEASGVKYDYHRIKKSAYTGYKPIKYSGALILMAEPEKALADYLYFIDIRQRGLYYERIDLRNIKRNKLIKYAKLFRRPGILKLIKEIYVNFRKPTRIY